MVACHLQCHLRNSTVEQQANSVDTAWSGHQQWSVSMVWCWGMERRGPPQPLCCCVSHRVGIMPPVLPISSGSPNLPLIQLFVGICHSPGLWPLFFFLYLFPDSWVVERSPIYGWHSWLPHPSASGTVQEPSGSLAMVLEFNPNWYCGYRHWN